MKLHRLILRNYRGITHRDIDFPENGVVVVSGANEVGKSSMIEALDLLLEAKDRSTKKEVKQVKPTHADEGAEVTAEISTGPYRFEYHKRFHKRPETRLTVFAPQREQLTGDEAHERVQAILADTVDTDLWQAQRVLQAASTAPVDLSGCDALSRALDVAAGEAAALAGALTGSEPLLIDRIDAEFRKYFTATGRATGVWSAAVARLRDAEQQVATCTADVAEVDDAVTRHGRLTGELARLSTVSGTAATRLDAARVAAAAVKQLSDRRAAAFAVSESAAKSRDASAAAVAERSRQRAEVDARAAAIAEFEPAAQRSEEAEAAARELAEAAEAAAAGARIAVDERQAALDAAQDTAKRVLERDEAQQLAARIAKVDAVGAQLVAVVDELARITLSDKLMKDVEAAASVRERAAAKAELASAHIELEAPAGVQVMVDGVEVPTGVWSGNVTTSTGVEVPGVLTLRVVPGAPAADSQATLDAAQQALDALLALAGVADVAAARELDCRRRDTAATRDRLQATVDALIGDDDIDDLRTRLDGLKEATEDGQELGDLEAARDALATASRAYRHARTECDVQGDAATRAAAAVLTAAGSATAAREKLSAARAEFAAATERLDRQRDLDSDDQLAAQAAEDRARATDEAARLEMVEAELAAAAPEAVAVELAEATTAVEQAEAKRVDVDGLLRDVQAQLQVYGSEGRQSRLDAALIELEDAAAEHTRLQRLSGAAELLRSVMMRHRDEARQRYVEPFRVELERLGRIVFGDSFEVEIDSELKISSRTLDGRTVPYESLSGGAKEQLGIVARLAGAALVAKEDTVPVVIDDALGFTDADRLAKMGAVFDVVGGDGQVIVLTCSPERFADVANAHHIQLTA